MILKMCDERTDTFMFVADVVQVQARYDYTFHVDENDCPIAVLLQFMHKEDKHNRIDRNNPNERCLDDFVLIKNTSVIMPCKEYLVNTKDVYKGEDIYSFKMLEIYRKTNKNLDDFSRYMLPIDKPVYLLNEDGKTIDRI